MADNKSYFYAFDETQGWNLSVYFSFWNDFYRDDEQMKYVEFAFLSFLSVISLIVNFALIIVFSLRKGLQSNQNKYIIAIMCSTVILIPFTVMIGANRLSHNGWIFGNISCKLTFSSVVATPFIRIWLMAVISIDRYINVVRAKHINRRISILLIVIGWAVPTTTTVLMIFPNSYTKTVIYDNETFTICTAGFAYHPSIRLSLLYFCTLFSFFFFAPSIAIVICYTKIMRAIERSTQSLMKHATANQKKSLKSNNRKTRTTKILIVIVAIFIIMWLPLFVSLAATTFDYVAGSFTMSSRVLIAILCVLIINTIIEPFLYSFTSSKARKELRNCMFCYKRSHVSSMEEALHTISTAS